MIADEAAARLGRSRRESGYDRAALSAVYGRETLEAADRGDYRALLAVAGDDRLGTWARLFTAGVPVARAAAEAALAPLGLDEALRMGLLVADPDGVRAGWGAQLDGDRLLFSDQLPGTTGARHAEHVLGVGGASRLLLDATPRAAVGSALDLGTGCGVQAVRLAEHATTVTATDVSGRALAFAALNAAVNGIELELLQGDLLEPVAGRRFDLVVSNPPFVIATPGSGWTYRDAGREADGVAAELAAAATGLLNPGGTMRFLANWLHVRGVDWTDRVAAWFPADGLRVWAVEREVLDPLDYVRTWQRDAGSDDPDEAAAWLDWFDARDVEEVGFGIVAMQRAEGPTAIVCEEARHAVETPWADRIADRFTVMGLDLEPGTLIDTRLRLADGVALQQAAALGVEGWEVERQWLQQRDGMRYAEAVDPLLVALLGSCDGSVPVRLQTQLLGETYGGDAAMLYAQLYPVLRRLVERGFLVPET